MHQCSPGAERIEEGHGDMRIAVANENTAAQDVIADAVIVRDVGEIIVRIGKKQQDVSAVVSGPGRLAQAHANRSLCRFGSGQQFLRGFWIQV